MQICMKLTANTRYEIAAAIKQKKESRALLVAHIARKTGIDPSQVSRICNGEFRTLSNHVVQICTYLGVDPNRPLGVEVSSSNLAEQLKAAIIELWDGTPSGAEALLRLLNQLDALQQRKPRKMNLRRMS